jgi:hypothetical protein
VTGTGCDNTSVGLTPITDLQDGSYQGVPGGLYPGARNEPPPEHLQAGIELARSVQPVDAAGSPNPDGKYVLLSIGMSNSSLEFRAFMDRAADDAEIDPHLVLVDGAQGGTDASRWVADGSPAWRILEQRLADAGVTPEQVQVAWVKETNTASERWPDYARTLQGDLAAITRELKDRFPNLELAYFSSRSYGGYSTDLNPEPFAYQTGFSVKWLVEDQIEGEQSLNFDEDRGPVEAPWIAWGPYLWADGLDARDDGLIWRCSDYRGAHPTEDGSRKVAELLLEFFRTDPTAREWYLYGT